MTVLDRPSRQAVVTPRHARAWGARLGLLISLCALTLSLAGGAWPSSARSQPASLTAPSTTAPDRAHITAALHSAPVMYIENVGQFDARARFQVRGGGGALWLAEDALWITVMERAQANEPDLPGFRKPSRSIEDQPRRGVNLKLSFIGANPHPRLEPFNRLDTHVSYFIGNDSTKWHADVPVWGGVRYVDLYPGIDLELSGNGGQWQPRIVARQGAEVRALRLRVEGADAVALEGGRLHLTTGVGTFSVPLLQVVTADGSPISGLGEGVGLRANEITLPFATERPTAVPPQDNPTDLFYSTFLGGGGYEGIDYGNSIAVDASGAAYVTGYTYSSTFPTTPGAFQTSCASYPLCVTAFVTKLNTVGSGLVYSTFLGGSNYDYGNSIAVDASGAAYVTGEAYSTDFPITPGAFQTTHGDHSDAYVTKLNATGSGLMYSTFLGGNSWEGGYGIVVDASGVAYITGDSRSSDFPTTPGAFQTTWGGGDCGGYPCPDAFVTKLNATGSGLVYSTYLGGNGSDWGDGIAIDPSGMVYVTGNTWLSDFPITPGAFQTTFGGISDAFVTKLNVTGSALVYSTFLGGSLEECGDIDTCDIAVDIAGEAYVTGETRSFDFPTTPGAFQVNCNGCSVYPYPADAYVTKLNASGSALVYSTFLGGSSYDSVSGIAVNTDGSADVAGSTPSYDFPTTPGAFQTTLGGNYDVYVTRLDADGSGLVYSTYLGGSGGEGSSDIALDTSGVAYVTGATSSTDFPTTPGAFQTRHASDVCGIPPNTYTCLDAFVTKLNLAMPTPGTPYRVYLPLILYDH